MVNESYDTHLSFEISGNHFSASYGASEFCWQIGFNFLQHLRPCHMCRVSIIIALEAFVKSWDWKSLIPLRPDNYTLPPGVGDSTEAIYWTRKRPVYACYVSKSAFPIVQSAYCGGCIVMIIIITIDIMKWLSPWCGAMRIWEVSSCRQIEVQI